MLFLLCLSPGGRDGGVGLSQEQQRSHHPQPIEEHQVDPEVEEGGGVQVRATCQPLWGKGHPAPIQLTCVDQHLNEVPGKKGTKVTELERGV